MENFSASKPSAADTEDRAQNSFLNHNLKCKTLFIGQGCLQRLNTQAIPTSKKQTSKEKNVSLKTPKVVKTVSIPLLEKRLVRRRSARYYKARDNQGD